MSTDYTPIGPVPSGIANGTVDATSRQLARDMRGKAYGKDVRETIARMTEWHSIRTSASEVLAAQSAASAEQSAQEVTQIAKVSEASIKQSAQNVTQIAQSALTLFNDAIRQQSQKIDNMVVDFTDYDFDSAPEIVAARRGKASLGAKIDEVDAQLAQKANENEVFLKESGINVNDFDEPTRQTFLEAQGIDINYVLGEENVQPKNTTYIYPSPENIYNYKSNSDNTRFGSDGQEVVGENFTSSDYIKVFAGVYVIGFPDSTDSANLSRIPFYDSNKDFVNILFNGTTFGAIRTIELTIPHSGYIRVTTYEEFKRSLVVAKKRILCWFS